MSLAWRGVSTRRLQDIRSVGVKRVFIALSHLEPGVESLLAIKVPHVFFVTNSACTPSTDELKIPNEQSRVAAKVSLPRALPLPPCGSLSSSLPPSLPLALLLSTCCRSLRTPLPPSLPSSLSLAISLARSLCLSVCPSVLVANYLPPRSLPASSLHLHRIAVLCNASSPSLGDA